MKKFLIFIIFMFVMVPRVYAYGYSEYNVTINLDENLANSDLGDIVIKLQDDTLSIHEVKLTKDKDYKYDLADKLRVGRIGFNSLAINNPENYSYSYKFYASGFRGSLDIYLGNNGIYRHNPIGLNAAINLNNPVENTYNEPEIDDDGGIIIGNPTTPPSQEIIVQITEPIITPEENFGDEYVYDYDSDYMDDAYIEAEEYYNSDEYLSSIESNNSSNSISNNGSNSNSNNNSDDLSEETVGVKDYSKVGLTIMKYFYIILGIVVVGFVGFGIVKVLRANK